MMLYVFHVDVGRMMSFNMSVAVSSVENLKETIERLHGIPAANIVLLVSGGEMLTHTTQVSYYSAGTDTNPIYMFLTGDAKLPTYLPPAADTDVDLRDQIERCLELPAVYETVATRAQLASQLHELAREEERVCDNLVHEQHLQQQGWSAVVANMEDLTEEFRRRFRNFCLAFDRHLEKRAKYLELLANFADDLAKLERIPVLPGLLPLAQEDFHGFDEFLDTDEVFSRSTAQQESVLMVGGGGSAEDPCETGDSAAAEEKKAEAEESTAMPSSSSEDKSSTSPNKKLKIGSDACTTSQTSTTSSNARRRTLNLLQWITSRENHNTLKLMSDECVQGLGTFTEEVYEKLKAEVQNVIKWAEQVDIKEIKGLGERLCKLDEFKYKIKQMVKDQKELSTAFQQNQNRAINLRDNSILPDLCASHRSQLQVMQQNHLKIRDHRRCIAKAKDELGANLHTRLKRIVWLENAMSEFDNRLLFYHRCLRRAERHISIIEQIHQAPNIYVAAVTEVVRRKIFSGEFRTWASKLAEDFESIHNEEIRRRQLFNASFEGHFLNILFPGMGDMPPAFANENPLVFDSRLPNLTRSDIELLASNLPHLSAEIQLPDMGPVINFFVSRSGEHQRDRLQQLLKDQVAAVLNVGGGAMVAAEKLAATPPQNQRLLELNRGCEESETDTETEFEKVRISRSNNDVSTSTADEQRPNVETMARSTTTEQLLLTHSATTMTDDNEASAAEARSEVQRLRGLLSTMSRTAVDCIRLTREQLQTCRVDADTCRSDLQTELEMLADKWQLLRMQSSERETLWKHSLAERDAELERLRVELLASSSECADLRQRVDDLLQLRDASELQVVELREKLEAALAERDQLKAEVAATREDLIREHKTEIESIRCRFKLMTSMERSPSDLSLERIERPLSAAGCADTIDAAQHEAALAQLRAAMEAERERAVAEAIEAERSLWQSKIFPMNSESVMVNVGMLKEMLEERDRQLEQMREHDLMQTKENLQLKTRLDALTNEEGNSWLQEKIEYLRRDKSRLEEELTMEKSRRLEMESSFAALKSSTYELAAPGATGSLTRSKSTASGSSQKLIVLESCAKGDIVFVVWSVRHGQFMVVQDSQSLYFVHSDSLAALNLRLPPASQSRELVAEGGGAAVGQLAVVPVAGAEEHLQQMPMPYYAIGRVVDKEYCQAKKDENRYRVTRGSKFYRIKLAPLQHRVATRRERLESFSTSISRSVSQGDSSEVSAAKLLLPSSMESSSATITGRHQMARHGVGKDVSDSPTTIMASTSPPIAIGGFPKERTISITSVNEEEDAVAIPGASGYVHNRYISVSEEEPAASTLTMTLAMQESGYSVALQTATQQATQQQQQPQMTTTIPAPLQQSVITEQPTASSKLKMDLLLASADIISTPIAAEQEQPQPAEGGVSGESCKADATIATLLPTISFGGTTTTSEDSDEYRSLDAKDDEDETDFPITE